MALWLSIIFGVVFGTAAVPMAPHPDEVSLLALIVNPTAYDGKRVRVTGFAVFEFETSALFLSREDATHGVEVNSVAVDTRRSLEELQQLNGRYVFIAATFKTTTGKNRRGYLESIEILQPVVPLRRFSGAETE